MGALAAVVATAEGPCAEVEDALEMGLWLLEVCRFWQGINWLPGHYPVLLASQATNVWGAALSTTEKGILLPGIHIFLLKCFFMCSKTCCNTHSKYHTMWHILVELSSDLKQHDTPNPIRQMA